MATVYRLARAVTSVAVLLALVVGIPITLVRFGSRHVPDGVPSLDEITVVLLHVEDGRLLIGLLIVAVWVFWLYLVIAVAIDVVDVLRNGVEVLHGRRVGPRALTGTLIVWALTTLNGPSASAAPPMPAPALTAAHTPSAAAPHADTYLVKPRDTLWDIASRELGDPLRWRDILDLNRGRPQADNATLTDAGHLKPGWLLVLPASQPSDGITVRSGDTLASIAQAELGDARR
ncbi:LysM peptidoglycan-binding domain-containing protein [Pseudonocardia xishanensis]